MRGERICRLPSTTFISTAPGRPIKLRGGKSFQPVGDFKVTPASVEGIGMANAAAFGKLRLQTVQHGLIGDLLPDRRT